MSTPDEFNSADSPRPDPTHVDASDVLDAPQLSFRSAGRADDPSGSVQRAREEREDALVVRQSAWGWTVCLPDGSPHTVALGYVDDSTRGRCDCMGFHYRDNNEPCAHLCVLYMHHVGRDQDATGEIVCLARTTTDAQAATDGGSVDAALRHDRERGGPL